MSDEVYVNLAKVLDTLPNGFKATEDGVEIKLLKKIFTPEQAELYCKLRLKSESAQQIAERTGLPLEGLEEKLQGMITAGQILGIPQGNTTFYKMWPWLFGIWEMQLHRLDKEMVELFEQFHPINGMQFFTDQPQQFRILPIEEEIEQFHQALPYEKVSSIIDNGRSFSIGDCVCKKEKELHDENCDKPLQSCMTIYPFEGAFDNSPHGKKVTQQEAREALKTFEELGLVHLTINYQKGAVFICNCCSCSCGVLAGINKMGIPASSVVNSHYYAMVDEELCTLCGICMDERCQVNAIEEGETSYKIIKDKCIGCGLCITTCEDEAIQLVRKEEADIAPPPADEKTWYTERGKKRGVDFSEFQ